MPKRDNWKSYSDDYKRIVFQTWYSKGRPSIPKLRDMIPVHGENRRPSIPVLKEWKSKEEWETRADEMDAKAIVLSDESLIQKKSQMLIRQAQMAIEMQDLGLKHIKEFGFDSSSAAVNSMVRGAELERTSRGIGEMIEKMAKMSDEQLKEAIIKRIQQASDSGQVIDIEAVDTESDEIEE